MCAFHVAVACQHIEFDGGAFCVGPFRQWAWPRGVVAESAEIGLRVVDPMLELPERAVVVVQANATTNFDADM